MDNVLFELFVIIAELLIIAGSFVVLVYAGKFISDKIKSSSYFKSSKYLNPQEYLPEEEVFTIKQVFYLVMVLILIIIMLYLLFGWREGSYNLLILDIVVSIYLGIQIDKSSFRNKCLLILLVPFGFLSYVILSEVVLVVWSILHMLAFVYFIKKYCQKFIEYTETNGLGITIMLLFIIIFISFFITIVVEGVSPLNSIVMVSNAFTSNGYAVLGSSGWGKMNALFLVWSGFILSGVGTATLAVEIVLRYANGRFDRLEELAKKNKKK